MSYADDDSDPDAQQPLPAGCPLDERRAPENRDPEIRRAFAEGKRFQAKRMLKRHAISLTSLAAIAAGLWQTGVIPTKEKEPVVSAVVIDKRLASLESKFEAMERAFTVRSTQNDSNLNEWRRDQIDYRAARDKQEERMNLILRRLDAISMKLGMQLGQAQAPLGEGVTVYAAPAVAEAR